MSHELDSVSVIETTAQHSPTRLQTRWIKLNSHIENDGIDSRILDISELIEKDANQSIGRFAGIMQPTDYDIILVHTRTFLAWTQESTAVRTKCLF